MSDLPKNMQLQCQKKTLANGVRVLVVPMHENPTVTVMVLAAVGAHHEPDESKGLAHFLEHCCFKGTPQWPTPKALSEELDKVGASYNAFTSREVTGYHVKAASVHFGRVFDVLADMYLNSTIPEHEIEKERKVIIEEIRMNNDDPSTLVHDDLMSKMYAGQVAAIDIAGTVDSVSQITRDQVVAFKQCAYVPEVTVVVIAGNVSAKEAFDKAESWFASHTIATHAVPRNPVHMKSVGPLISYYEKDTEQMHMAIGFHSFNIYDLRTYAGSVLRTVLRGGMSSRLFQKIREERGLCYYIGAGNTLMADYGRFGITMGVNHSRAAEAVEAVLAELRLIANEMISDEEMKKAKDYLLGKYIMGYETSEDIADFYGSRELDGKPMETPAAIYEKLSRVTTEEVRALARDIFRPEHFFMSMISGAKEREAAEKGVREVIATWQQAYTPQI